MAEEKKFLVKGRYEGQEIEESIMAYSDKQAKLKAGMKNGIGGQRLTEFMRSRNIRAVRRI